MTLRMRLRAKLAIAIVLVACGALVLWVRLLPLEISNGDADGSRSPDWTYVAEDGREHVYLGDLDSYLWLRHARTLLPIGQEVAVLVLFMLVTVPLGYLIFKRIERHCKQLGTLSMH